MLALLNPDGRKSLHHSLEELALRLDLNSRFSASRKEFLCALCGECFAELRKSITTEGTKEYKTWDQAGKEATPRVKSKTRTANRSGSGLGRSSQPILGIPANRRRPFGRLCAFWRPFELHDFPGPVRLFFVAVRAANIEDLGFSRSGSSGVAGRLLQAGYNCWNGNGCLAVQANYPAESLMFGFNGHCLILV